MAIYRQRAGVVEAVYFDGEDFFEAVTKGKDKTQISPWFLDAIASSKIFHGEDGWWIANEEADTYGGPDKKIYPRRFVVWDEGRKWLRTMSCDEFAREYALLDM